MNRALESPTEPGQDVSRSGRVRKKNSFLAEYASPDEVVQPVKKGRPLKYAREESKEQDGYVSSDVDDITVNSVDETKVVKKKPAPKLKLNLNVKRNLKKPKLSHHHQQQQQLKGTVERGPGPSLILGSTSKGPKGNKKGKGGRPMGSGKDKAAPRVTAYTLFLKDQREMFSKKYPQMDSASLSKKLNEIWATVPPNQKKMWKNKADKMMKKSLNIKSSAPVITLTSKGKRRGRPRIHPISTVPEPGAGVGMNGGSFSHITKGSHLIPGKFKVIRKKAGVGGTVKRKINNNQNQRVQQQQQQQWTSNGNGSFPFPSTQKSIIPTPGFQVGSFPFLTSRTKQLSLSPVKDDDKYRVTGTGTLDVAAHFALLGESLSIIGNRLMDVERQPVSGSLSVLMDSLLCAITPLVCLTQQVPELNCIPQERLTRLLDNIAYVMPGL